MMAYPGQTLSRMTLGQLCFALWDSQSRTVVIQPGIEQCITSQMPLTLRCSALDRCASREPYIGMYRATFGDVALRAFMSSLLKGRNLYFGSLPVEFLLHSYITTQQDKLSHWLPDLGSNSIRKCFKGRISLHTPCVLAPRLLLKTHWMRSQRSRPSDLLLQWILRRRHSKSREDARSMQLRFSQILDLCLIEIAWLTGPIE